VIVPEGGSQLNPDVTGEKANTPGNGQTTDGFSEDGRDGRVTLDDWIRLNDRDGDGVVDRNTVDLSGDGAAEEDGQQAGNGGFLPPIDRDYPGRTNPGGIYTPPGATNGGDNGGLPPGFVDRDGDGFADLVIDPVRPDLPPAGMPGYNPPAVRPGLEVPVGVYPPGPGPRFDPDENPTAPGHRPNPPHDDVPDPSDHGRIAPPPGYGEPQAGAAPYVPGAPGAAEPAGGAGLDVFKTPPAAAAAPATPLIPAAEVPSATSDVPAPALAGLQPPASASPAATAGSEPTLEFQALPGSDIAAGPAPQEEAAISPEVAALVESVRRAVASLGGSDGDDEESRRGGMSLIEKVIDSVRDAIFLSDDGPSDGELAAQILRLPPDQLDELERFAAEQDEQAAD